MAKPRCYHCGHLLADINAPCPQCLPNGVPSLSHIMGDSHAPTPGESDTTTQLTASITDLGASIDRANLRLELTREALRAALGSESRYRYVIGAIEAAVREPVAERGGMRVIGSLDGIAGWMTAPDAREWFRLDPDEPVLTELDDAITRFAGKHPAVTWPRVTFLRVDTSEPWICIDGWIARPADQGPPPTEADIPMGFV